MSRPNLRYFLYRGMIAQIEQTPSGTFFGSVFDTRDENADIGRFSYAKSFDCAYDQIQRIVDDHFRSLDAPAELLHHRGFYGSIVAPTTEDVHFRGCVRDTPMLYHGSTIEELELAFQGKVDTYIASIEEEYGND